MLFETMNQALFTWIAPTHSSDAALTLLRDVALGPVWLLPPLTAMLWLLGGRSDRDAAVFAAATACTALLCAHVISGLIDHPRPFMMGLAPNRLDHDADSSFPSDHATLFFGLAAAFCGRPAPRLPKLAAVLALAGLAVGLSRVALGVHFPFDIFGATLIGVGSALAVVVGLRRPLVILSGMAEKIRHFISVLAARDRREDSPAGGDARSAG